MSSSLIWSSPPLPECKRCVHEYFSRMLHVFPIHIALITPVTTDEG